MNRILILTVLACTVSCNIGFLQSQFPYPQGNQLKLTLDDDLKTKAKVSSYGEITVQFNLFQIESYVTAPDCINCEVYGNGEEEPFTCNSRTQCMVNRSFKNIEVAQHFRANGDIIQMNIELDYIQTSLSLLYVRQINELSLGKTYHYHGIGMAMDRGEKSDFMFSLYQQGKINNFSYSLYYDNSYHLTLGGFNQKLIEREFYNLKKKTSELWSPYTVVNDQVLADLTLSSELIMSNVAVQIDPAIDNIILPISIYEFFVQSLQNQHLIPDASTFTWQDLGQWKNLQTAPSFTISFILDDPDAISNQIDVVFSPQEFMMRNEQGYYTPKIVFDNTQRPNSNYLNVVRIGKLLLKKMMYYKYATHNYDEGFITDIRCLAPLKKIHSQN